MMSSVYIGLLASLLTYISHKQRSRQRLKLCSGNNCKPVDYLQAYVAMADVIIRLASIEFLVKLAVPGNMHYDKVAVE